VNELAAEGAILRDRRAVRACELISTDKARRELKRLAQGADGAPLTRDAQAALKRLELKPYTAPAGKMAGASDAALPRLLAWRPGNGHDPPAPGRDAAASPARTAKQDGTAGPVLAPTRKGIPMECSDFITFLYTADLDRADSFYGSKLGLRLVLDQGTCRVYRVGPNAYLGLCRARPGREQSARGVIITFITEDVEGRHAELRSRGVVFESAPAFNRDYNITHCFLRDPDGHLLEIQRFEDPKWRRSDC
jgi:catechol 2,3-dioxygenase-like lactoylglutathione lyase family enzyme